MNLVYLNGMFVEKEKACVSVLDHGFLYGDGIFETMRSYHGVVYLIEEHVERLLRSAKAVFIPVPLSKAGIKEAINNTLKQNELKDAYIRLTISRGYGEPGLSPSLCTHPTIVIYAKQFVPYPQEWYKKGIKISRILSGNSVIKSVKSCNYLNNILAKREASQQGAQEAIFINDRGYVSEGTVSNIFIVKDDVLITPSITDNILPGITRKMVIELSKKTGIQVEETVVKEEDILSSDECFLTNTGFEIMPVSEFHLKKRWEKRPGAVTALLMEKFKENI